MSWFPERNALAIVALSAGICYGASAASAQDGATGSLVTRAQVLAEKIHRYHDLEYPPSDYCATMAEARGLLGQLQVAAAIGPTLPVVEPIRTAAVFSAARAGFRLADEIAEEDAINDYYDYDPCWRHRFFLSALMQDLLTANTAATGSPNNPTKWFVTLDSGVVKNGYKFGDGFSLDHSTGVFGVRAGVDWSLGNASTWGLMGGFYKPLEGARDRSFKTELRWFGTAEVKLATPVAKNVRLWGSGGFAWGEIDVRTDFVTDTARATGWTVGAGFNYEFQPAWNIGLTYRHVDLGPKDVRKFGTDVRTESNQFFLSLQKNFIP